MEITAVLKVTKDEFFDYIEKALTADVRSADPQKQDLKVINIVPGLHYTKRLRRDDDPKHDKLMEVTISDYRRGKSYAVRFRTKELEYTVGYELLHSDSESIEVKYQERYERLDRLPWIIRALLPHRVVNNSRSRMRKALKNIENQIIALRN